MLRFPYGLADFARLITGGYWYCDRTGVLPELEQAGDQLLFLRPRRFGKSLWLSVLENYYDLAKAEHFERLFGHLAIGQQPTPNHNRYFILRWNFSLIDPTGDHEAIAASVHRHLNAATEFFSAHYHAQLPECRVPCDHRQPF